MTELLSEKQREVMARVLAEEEAKREHLVVALSGAHAYGFPSPDSDLDLKSIHVERTERLLGLEVTELHADRMEVIEGVEVDYSSNELKPVLLGVLQGNGNYIERVLGSLQPLASRDLAELRPLVKRCLSRRMFRHYIGFATSQLKAFDAEVPGSAKKLLYVLRTTLTGAQALAAGEIVTDLGALVDEHGFSAARELIAAKRAGERVALSPEMAATWRAEVTRAFDALVAARDASPLPEEPAGARELDAWLVAARRKRL
jgi:uncharacterized protein